MSPGRRRPAVYRVAGIVRGWLADFSRDPRSALATIRLWCKDASIELIDTLIVTGTGRGEGARKREDLLRGAFELGVRLS
mgnify:CR=1 FL=1